MATPASSLQRRAVVGRILRERADALVVASLGNPCYDLMAQGDRPDNFYVWGAMGGTVPLQETVWASYFGRGHLGEIRSVAMPFTIVFSAGGPLLAGVVFDRTGSYDNALVLFAAFSMVGLILVLLARPPKQPLRLVPSHDDS